MRKILINTRGEFDAERKDYAMAIAVKKLAEMVKPKEPEPGQEEKVIVYNKVLQWTNR